MAQKQVVLTEQEYNELLKWKQFVEKLWYSPGAGPYGNEISNELRYEMQDLFNFDDSE